MVSYKAMHILAVAAIALAATVDGRHVHVGARHGRGLLQRLPVTQSAKELATNATLGGRSAIAAFGTSNATLAALVDTYMLAHGSADPVFEAAAAGQTSAAIAAAAAAGASQLATASVLANDSAARNEADAALTDAEGLVSSLLDVNPLTVSDKTFASLELLANIAHDGTLIQYWQNLTNGQNYDNNTFISTVEFAAGLPEAAEEGAAAGATAMAVIAAEVAGRNLLGALYVFDGNNTLAFQESIANSRAIIKAANGLAANASCSPARATALAEQAEQAAAAAANAAMSLSVSDIEAARTAALELVSAATGNNGCTGFFPTAPTPAPGSVLVSAASTG